MPLLLVGVKWGQARRLQDAQYLLADALFYAALRIWTGARSKTCMPCVQRRPSSC